MAQCFTLKTQTKIKFGGIFTHFFILCMIWNHWFHTTQVTVVFQPDVPATGKNRDSPVLQVSGSVLSIATPEKPKLLPFTRWFTAFSQFQAVVRAATRSAKSHSWPSRILAGLRTSCTCSAWWSAIASAKYRAVPVWWWNRRLRCAPRSQMHGVPSKLASIPTRRNRTKTQKRRPH